MKTAHGLCHPEAGLAPFPGPRPLRAAGHAGARIRPGGQADAQDMAPLPDGGPGPGPAAADADGDAFCRSRRVQAGQAGFTIDGMRGAACAWLIERRLAQVPGVRRVAVDAGAARAWVRWDPQLCGIRTLLRTLRGLGYRAWPYDQRRHGARLEHARRSLGRRLFVAGLSLAQLMMYALPAWLAGDDGAGGGAAALVHWISLLLALPVVLYAALPFYQGAWRDLRRGLPGADVPVVLGIAAVFGGSCAGLLGGRGEVHFAALAAFIFVLLGSRWLALDARRRTVDALDAFRDGLPAAALRLRGDPAARDIDTVAASRLKAGDLVLVQPGQAVPADGVVMEGETEIDLALLTGESRTQRKGAGDNLPGGAVNVAQAIVVRLTSSACDSTLAVLVGLAESAGQGKPVVAHWAERAGVWFVPALLLFDAAVFCAWQLVDPARAWQAAIAVLVVSCPCALTLATPTAVAAATGRLLRGGVLAVAPHTLETFERATHIVFDKTGTLTLGRPVLHQTLPVGPLGAAHCLRIAAALEADNAHPLGVALRAAAGMPGLVARHLNYEVGQGVEGGIDGVTYRVGSAAFVAGLAGGVARSAAPPGTSSVWLGCAGAWLARFDLQDVLRSDAAAVVQRFRKGGKTIVLLSGDDARATQAVASRLGIASAFGGRLPGEKLAFVQKLQQDGAVVAMVGDGVNDAAVMRGADVSFAMGHGAELAQLHADGILLGHGLAPLAEAADTARRTLATIRQNLAWGAVYNLVAIPAAAAGVLSPWAAGIGMAASSALVLLNAQRLSKG